MKSSERTTMDRSDEQFFDALGYVAAQRYMNSPRDIGGVEHGMERLRILMAESTHIKNPRDKFDAATAMFWRGWHRCLAEAEAPDESGSFDTWLARVRGMHESHPAMGPNSTCVVVPAEWDHPCWQALYDEGRSPEELYLATDEHFQIYGW